MPTVLVVEDDEATRNLLVTALSRLGIEAAAAEDGARALDVIDTAPAPIRLILLDLLMPRTNGREFLQQLALRPAPRPTVILVTAAVGFEDLPSDVDLVIKKPFEIAALTSTVTRILQSGPALPPFMLRAEPEAPAGSE